MKTAVIYADRQGTLATVVVSDASIGKVRADADSAGYAVCGVIPAQTLSEFNHTIAAEKRAAS